MPIKRLLGLQASKIIMGVIALLSFVTVYSLISSFRWVEHTHQVIYQIHRVKDDLTDCQTSVREVVFADNKEFLNKYLEKSPLIEMEVDQLQYLTRDNEIQQKNVYHLRQNISRRMSTFRETVELYKSGKIDEAQTLLKEKFGESWISSTRNLAEIIESEELRLLELRLSDYKQKSSVVLYGIPLLMIIYIMVFSSSTKFLESHLTP